MSKESILEFAGNNPVVLIALSFFMLFGTPFLIWLNLKRKIKKSGLTEAEYFKKHPVKTRYHSQSGD